MPKNAFLENFKQKKNLRLVSQKMDISKQYNGGPFRSAAGRIPEGEGHPPTSLNQPLVRSLELRIHELLSHLIN